MDSIVVLYFLEDIAHEKFIRALVDRVAHQVAEALGISSLQIKEEVRNATGGRGATLTEFSRFLRENKGLVSDILIVAIDANCRRYTRQKQEILSLVKIAEIRWQVVCAVPDPHIERWYLSDPSAIPRAFGVKSDYQVELPKYKCKRGWYKNELRRIIENAAGFVPQLGGAEYGQEIAKAMDLYTAVKGDRALKHFIDDLKQAFSYFLRPLAESEGK